MSSQCEGKTQASEPPEELVTMLETEATVMGWLRLPTTRQLMLAFRFDQAGEPHVIDLKVMDATEAERLLGSVRPDAQEDTSWRLQYNVYRPRPVVTDEQFAKMETLLRGLAVSLQ